MARESPRRAIDALSDDEVANESSKRQLDNLSDGEDLGQPYKNIAVNSEPQRKPVVLSPLCSLHNSTSSVRVRARLAHVVQTVCTCARQRKQGLHRSCNHQFVDDVDVLTGIRVVGHRLENQDMDNEVPLPSTTNLFSIMPTNPCNQL